MTFFHKAMLRLEDELVCVKVLNDSVPHNGLHHLAQHTGQTHWSVVPRRRLRPLLENRCDVGPPPVIRHNTFSEGASVDDGQRYSDTVDHSL